MNRRVESEVVVKQIRGTTVPHETVPILEYHKIPATPFYISPTKRYRYNAKPAHTITLRQLTTTVNGQSSTHTAPNSQIRGAGTQLPVFSSLRTAGRWQCGQLGTGGQGWANQSRWGRDDLKHR